jgi:hypothetical protein
MSIELKDAKHQRELDRDGFTIVPLLERAAAQALLSDAIAIRGEHYPPSAIAGSALTYHSTSLDADPRYRKALYDLIRDRVTPALSRFLTPYELVTAGLLVKQPGTGELRIHTDWTMTRDVRGQTLTVWFPLIDVDERNGALRLVKGSHRLVDQICGPGVNDFYLSFQDKVEEMASTIPLSAGEALIFDSTILHGSPENQSNSIRPAVMLSCVGSGELPVFYRYDDKDPQHRFAVFDISDAVHLRHAPDEYFSGKAPGTRLGEAPNNNQPISFGGFKRRKAAAKMYRRLPGNRDLWKLFEVLPVFR